MTGYGPYDPTDPDQVLIQPYQPSLLPKPMPYFDGTDRMDNAQGTPAQSVTYDSLVKGGLDQSTVAYLQKLMALRGYIEGKYNPGIWDEKTKDGLRLAFTDTQNGNYTFGQVLGITPEQLQSGDLSGVGGSSGPQPTRSVGNSTSTSTSSSRSVNLSTRSGARAVLAGALASELGREPTANEVQSFMKGLNRAEQKWASTSTSTSTSSSHDVSRSDGKGHSTSTSSSTSDSNSDSISHNFSPEQMAQRFARQNNKQEFKQYQDAGYYDVIAGMLGM